MKVCGVQGCLEKHKAKGYCRIHYTNMVRHGDPLYVKARNVCTVGGCHGPHSAKGFCEKHYKMVRAYGRTDYKKPELGCSVKECPDPHYGKGFCSKHYQRFNKHGDPMHVAPWLKDMKEIFLNRFWARVEMIPFTTCWWWIGSARNGYGIIKREGKATMARRASYEMHKSKIPEGMHVCHSCDNPSCVNPDHLWLGTHDDNMKDMASKGRGRSHGRVGEQLTQAKLRESDVHAIRKIGKSMPQGKIAEMFGVSRENIGQILRRQSWRHI